MLTYRLTSSVTLYCVRMLTQKKRVVKVTRTLTRGTLETAQELLKKTARCKQFNGTMRERLASLARKCRHAAHRLETLEAGMYLIGCTYNFCWPHQELSTTKQYGRPCTPAIAAGLTDHIWSVCELLSYKVAPAPWIESKHARCSRKGAACDPALPKRPRGRPRKHPLPDPSLPKRPRGRPRKVA